jgi:RNA recognition motif-containing protein
MNKRLFIAGLPFSSNDQDIKIHFSAAGVVTMVQIITDKMTGRSKGFGFVSMNDDAAAMKAIEELNDKDFEGRQIRVNEATPFDPSKPRPERRFGGGDRGFGGDRGGFGGNRGGGFGGNRRFGGSGGGNRGGGFGGRDRDNRRENSNDRY